MDVVEYGVGIGDGRVRKVKIGICPDSYFVVVDERRNIDGSPARARFLIELDMSTHVNPSFGREKATPGAAYIKSPAFKTRFGYNSGKFDPGGCENGADAVKKRLEYFFAFSYF